MEKVKDFYNENRLLIIIFIIVIIGAISLLIYNTSQKEKIFEPIAPSDDNYIKTNYQVNEYRPVTIELSDLLNEYYKEFMTKQVKDPEAAYQMLTDETKKSFNNDYQEYKKYLNQVLTINSLKNEVREYRIDKDNKSIIEIIDSEDNKYTIYENAVWDIKISIDGKK